MPRAPTARSLGASQLAIGDFTIFRDTVVAHGTTDGTATSNVGEPTVANDRNGLLFTGNWYAKVSGDNGLTWRRNLAPSTVFDSLPQTPELSGGCSAAIRSPTRSTTTADRWCSG